MCVDRLLQRVNRLSIYSPCSIVVLQTGITDLTDDRCTVHKFISLLWRYIDLLVHKYQPKAVVVMEIMHHKLPLWYHMKMSIKEYNSWVDACNSELQKLPNATFWSHGRRLCGPTQASLSFASDSSNEHQQRLLVVQRPLLLRYGSELVFWTQHIKTHAMHNHLSLYASTPTMAMLSWL